MEKLDLNLLRVLEALFTQRSVSGAARALGVTQPGVSLACEGCARISGTNFSCGRALRWSRPWWPSG